MNISVVGKIYRVVDKATNKIVKIGSTTRTIQQRFGQSDYKRKYKNHFVEEVKTISSSELDWYDPNDSYCPFLWHLAASEHLEMLSARTFRTSDLSNLFSPLDQKFFNRFGSHHLSSLGGQIGGRTHVSSGHLKSISSKGGLSSGPSNGRVNGTALFKAKKGLFKYPSIAVRGGKAGGRVSGRIAVESGQLASLRTTEHQSKASKSANHNRWHLNRNIVNPNCSLCNEALNVAGQSGLQTVRESV